MSEKPYITGYYGCSCHPFHSWKESDAAHKYPFRVGDAVKHRCFDKTGVVDSVEGQGFFIVKWGNSGLARDFELEHAATLKYIV